MAVRQAASSDALPMRDAFAVLFLVSVGMLFDPGFLIEQPLMVAAVLAVIVDFNVNTVLALRARGRMPSSGTHPPESSVSLIRAVTSGGIVSPLIATGRDEAIRGLVAARPRKRVPATVSREQLGWPRLIPQATDAGPGLWSITSRLPAGTFLHRFGQAGKGPGH